MSLSPDFDAIVRLRKPKNIEKVQINDDIKFVKNYKKGKTIITPKRTIIKSLSLEQKMKLCYINKKYSES